MSDVLQDIYRRLDALQKWQDTAASVELPALNRGSSFPASWPQDVPFYRTDLDLLCYYDGTRWLTVQEYPSTFASWGGAATPFSVTTNPLLMPWFNDQGVYITRAAYTLFVDTTNNGSNYWSIDLQRDTSSVWASNTSALAASTTYTVNQAVNAVHTPSGYFRWNTTKVNSPGVLFFSGAFKYRLIVT